nr:hypothetical protein [Nocardioides flavescens]
MSRRAVRTAVALATALGAVSLPFLAASPGSAATPSVVAMRGITPLPEVATTVGKSFWLSYGTFNVNGDPIQRRLFVTSDEAGTVSLMNRAGTVLASASLAPGAVATLDVPAGSAAPAGDGKSNSGLRVVSTVPASVYPAALVDYASSGFQALPDTSLGTSYRVLGYPQPAIGQQGLESRLLVTASVDATTVTITPKTVVGDHPAGVPFVVSLDAGQTYQFQSTLKGQDVTGTTVSATQPVAVVGGNACAQVPATYVACNPLTAQLPPTRAWGTTFVSGRFATRTKGDTYRVLADQDETQVRVGGTLVATLAAGDFYEAVLPADRATSANEAVVITTSKPALVAQYGNGRGYDGTTSDPIMTLVTPIGQHLTSYTVGAPSAVTNDVPMQPYLSLVVQTRDVGAVLLDGVAVPAAAFVTAPGTAYSVAQIKTTTGQHVLRSPHQFGVTVYEWGDADGLAFPGGSALAPIADAPAPPAPENLTSTGVATAQQQVTVPVGDQQEVHLFDGTKTVDTLTVAGQGTYTLDPTTGVITFAPVLGYAGTATPVTFRVRDAWNQQADATYTPTVTKPAAPTASPLTSRARGAQSVSVTLPTGGSLALVGDPVVAGQGTYSVNGATVTFTPLDSYDGTATPATYEVTDAYGQKASSTYTPTALPAVPAPTPLTSRARGVQSVTVTLPKGGSLALVGDPLVPGQGTYSVKDATITFTPLDSYDGTATPVTYEVTDGYGQTGTSTYTPTALPAVPAPTPLTSRARGVQSVTVALPKGGSLALVGDPLVPGQGTYSVKDATITFTPLETYAGTATPVTYEVTDGYGQKATSTYTPTALPVAPTASPLTSVGEGTQSVQLTVPKGGTSVLVDGTGKETTQVGVAQGTYLLDVATATVSFVPSPGVSGTATPVTYRVVDSFDQTADSTYTPTVVAPVAALPALPAPVVDPRATLRLPELTRTAPGAKASVRTTCSTDVAAIGSCRVRLWASVKGQRTEIGSATTIAGGGSSQVVKVRLNAVGRALAATPGGVPVTGELTLTTAAGATRTATAVGRVVMRRFTLARAAHFAHASATLSKADARYARVVSRRAGAVRVVTCTGYTDSSGGAELNQRLGRQRALALCSALDLPASVRVVIRTRGERSPEASNATAGGRERNRRATITLRY